MEDPAPWLDVQGKAMAQAAGLMADFYKSCVGAGLPADIASGVVQDWWREAISGDAWSLAFPEDAEDEDLSDGRDDQ